MRVVGRDHLSGVNLEWAPSKHFTVFRSNVPSKLFSEMIFLFIRILDDLYTICRMGRELVSVLDTLTIFFCHICLLKEY